MNTLVSKPQGALEWCVMFLGIAVGPVIAIIIAILLAFDKDEPN